jgi:Na+-translocating ferredoxin:NAD+ oxidoreductase RnfA subunit
MRALGIIVQVTVTLFFIVLTMNLIETWSHLNGFNTFVLGFASGTGTSLGVVYGILRKRKKPATPDYSKGECYCLHCDPQ